MVAPLEPRDPPKNASPDWWCLTYSIAITHPWHPARCDTLDPTPGETCLNNWNLTAEMTSWHQTPTYPRWAWVLARAGVKQRLVKLLLTVENMISAGGRHMHLLPSVIFHEAQLVKFLIGNAVWNTCHGIRLQDSYFLKQREGGENFACKDTTPSFLLNPEHQLHRGLQNIFFFLLLESTDLHGITLLSKHACTSSWLVFALLREPRRSNFLNVRAWQLDDI